MLAYGLLFGLLGAFSQALSYLFSRRFLSREGRHPLQLLVLGHLGMGLLSLLALPFVWQPPKAGWYPMGIALAGTAGFYLLGQFGFFTALRHAPASQLSPLLGLKILYIAVLGTLFYSKTLRPSQWLAVALAVIATLLVRKASDQLGWKPLVAIGLTCLGYCLSDLSIEKLVAALGDKDSPLTAFRAVVITYTLCGLVSLGFVRTIGKADMVAWQEVVGFSLTWFLGMCGLFASIAMTGVVLAVIVQSTRGPMSVALGGLIAYWGHLHIEHHLSKRERLRQGLAAAFMCAAIALYQVA